MALTVALASLLLAACTSPPSVGNVLEPVATLKIDSSDAIKKVAVSPDGDYVAAQGYSTKQIYVLNVATRKLIHRLPLYHGGGVNFSPDGKHLYTSDWIPDSDVSLVVRRGTQYEETQYRKRKPEEQFKGHRWEVATGNKLKTFYREGDEVKGCNLYDMRFSSDGRLYITGVDRGLYLCETDTAKLVRFIRYPWINEQGRPVGWPRADYLQSPKAFFLSRDWNTAFVAANKHFIGVDKEDHTVETRLLWFNLATGQVERSVPVSPRKPADFGIDPLALSADGRRIAVATWYYGEGEKEDIIRARVRVFNALTGESLVEIDDTSLQIGISNMVFSPRGNYLLVGGERLTIWEIPSGRKIGEFKPPSRHPVHIDLSADGHTFVAGVEDTIYLWSMKNTEQRTAR